MSRSGLVAAAAAAAVCLGLGSAASASTVPADQTPTWLSSSVLQSTVVGGGVTVLPTTRTVQHWFQQTTDPVNGVSYGYNMVGADPTSCPGSDCSVTIQADITPVNVVVDGQTFDATQLVNPLLASPLFATNDYGSTPYGTLPGSFPSLPLDVRGPGGKLSQADAGIPLQLEDAVMRAQFGLTGKQSSYHLILQPNIEPPVTITVPGNHSALFTGVDGVVSPEVDRYWWGSAINNLTNSADPTHLPIYLTNDLYLYLNDNPSHCCVIGFHGDGNHGNTGSNGNAAVQTFIWATWQQPGSFAAPNGGSKWAFQDIDTLSHEVSEWADDPFLDNTVNPWSSQSNPGYGCVGLLETGDPVTGVGFAMGHNTYAQGPNPDGTHSADGYYHPEDEAFLPWFIQLAPNLISEPTQHNSADVGRYSFMGDLNPYAGSRQPANGC